MKQYNKQQLTLQPDDDPGIHKVCLILCEYDGVTDPYREATGISTLSNAKGLTYKLWEYRLPVAREIIKFLNSQRSEVF